MLSIEKRHEKRKCIAKSTCELFIEKGYVNITISQIAKVAGIGKGTIYEYFKNKEDIIFELMACLQEEYDVVLNKKLKSDISVKEKLLCLCDIFLSDDTVVLTQRKIYKEFLSIYINEKTEEMISYNNKMMEKYSLILEEIFSQSIRKKEISSLSLSLIPSIFATLQGFLIISDDKTLMIDYIDNLFLLLEKEIIEKEV
jgi:AcrR family transcriptional regulator